MRLNKTLSQNVKGKNKRVPQQGTMVRNSGVNKAARRVGAISSNRPEVKAVDTAFSSTILTATATWSTLQLCNAIAQGAGENQRIGRKIAMKSFTTRWTYVNGTTGTGQGPVRLMWFYDHAPNGTAPLITDVLAANSINAHVNLNNTDRFVILKDMYLNGSDGMPYSAYQEGNGGKFTLKFNLEEQFEDILANIASISTGAIFFSFVTTTTTVSASSASVSQTTRVRYTDN